MAMNPYDFYSAFVQENYYDFSNEPDNIRKGINAAVSAFHMADHYFNYYKRNDPSKIAPYNKRADFLRHIEGRSRYFVDIQSIANAYKHLYLDSSQSYVSIASAGCIESIIFEQDNITVDGCGQDDKGNFIVIYTTTSSQKVKLLEALKDVVNMWSNFLYDT
jgi:hypothetical protein